MALMKINVSCYMIKLDFWPWPTCWKMVPERLLSHRHWCCL